MVCMGEGNGCISMHCQYQSDVLSMWHNNLLQEELLATDNLFVEYFNTFLGLPVSTLNFYAVTHSHVVFMHTAMWNKVHACIHSENMSIYHLLRNISEARRNAMLGLH